MSDNIAVSTLTIAVAGGTGKEGKGLAYRWSRAGLRVIIGSRQLEKAEAAVAELKSLGAPSASLSAMTNLEAAKQADVITVTVPYAAHQPLLAELKPVLQGKTVIDVTVPLVPPKVTKVQMPAAGSAAQEARQILGEEVKIASAFQNISFERLMREGDIDCDVLVCGTDKDTRKLVVELAKLAGLTAWDAGPLENSVVVEGMTSVLIGINKQFDVPSSGIQITGVPRP
ncbi:MAG TPA: NADPH-dependent F420 reductase [Longilinea sp.]|nr:NADPH-dependent F420 reductase [Longilinea sp.]